MLKKIKDFKSQRIVKANLNQKGSKEKKGFDWLCQSDYIGTITPKEAILLEEAKSKNSKEPKELHQHIHYHQR